MHNRKKDPAARKLIVMICLTYLFLVVELAVGIITGKRFHCTEFLGVSLSLGGEILDFWIQFHLNLNFELLRFIICIFI